MEKETIETEIVNTVPSRQRKYSYLHDHLPGYQIMR